MDAPNAPPQSLEELRREIDRVDDAILKLVDERLQMIDRVRSFKNGKADGRSSPMRPGREAAILKRLIENAGDRVPTDLCFKLWRALISAATQRQAPVRVHGPIGLFTSASAYHLIKEHFGSAELVGHPGEAMTLQAVASQPGDVAAVATGGPWMKPFLDGLAGKAQVIGCLPFLAQEAQPRLLIFGHAALEQTGADETLVVTDGQLPRDFAPAPKWQVRSDGKRLACLPGFLSEHSMPLSGLIRSNSKLALTVIGRYPSPIEVRS
jgi:chorismate mutase / prephenate dehydratase